MELTENHSTSPRKVKKNQLILSNERVEIDGNPELANVIENTPELQMVNQSNTESVQNLIQNVSEDEKHLKYQNLTSESQ